MEATTRKGAGTGTGTDTGAETTERCSVEAPSGSGSPAKAHDFIDGQHIVAKPDIARLVVTFEGLSYFNNEYVPTIDGLAEEITADAARPVDDPAAGRGRVSTARPWTRMT